jgi:hypothetical protein
LEFSKGESAYFLNYLKLKSAPLGLPPKGERSSPRLSEGQGDRGLPFLDLYIFKELPSPLEPPKGERRGAKRWHSAFG